MPAKAIAKFIEKASRLYEQKRSAVLAATALEMYVRQWLRWAGNALCETVVRVGKQPMGMGCSPLYLRSTGVEDDVLYVVIVGCAGMINW